MQNKNQIQLEETKQKPSDAQKKPIKKNLVIDTDKISDEYNNMNQLNNFTNEEDGQTKTQFTGN